MPEFPRSTVAFIPVDSTRDWSRLLFRAVMPSALLAAMLSTSGCLFQKKAVRVYHPPPIQRPKIDPLTLPNLDPPVMDVELEASFNSADLGQTIPEFAPPPPPVPAPRPRPPVAVGPKPVPPPVVPETPAPKIVQIFPAEQQRALNQEVDGILDRDQKALERLARMNLAADQREKMAQIQEFLTQAKQAREQDLMTAVNLARHADTLAKDLLGRLP
jgi:hypothetical protein